MKHLIFILFIVVVSLLLAFIGASNAQEAVDRCAAFLSGGPGTSIAGNEQPTLWSPDGVTYQACLGYYRDGVKPDTFEPDWRFESTHVDLWCGVPLVANTMQPMIVRLYPTAGSDYDLCVWEADPNWQDDPKYGECFQAVFNELVDQPTPDGYVDGSGKSSDHVDIVTLPMGIAGMMLCVDRYNWGHSGSWVIDAILLDTGQGD